MVSWTNAMNRNTTRWGQQALLRQPPAVRLTTLIWLISSFNQLAISTASR